MAVLGEEAVRVLNWVAELVQLTERRTDDVAGHGQRVAEMCRPLGECLGLSARERAILWHAARLHDIGTLVISDLLFRMPGPVGPEQEVLFRSHPRVGADLLSGLPMAAPVAPLALHHHERVDGRGFPDGVTGDELTLPDRILIVANAFDAMVHPRPYLWHEAASHAQAFRRLREGRANAYDPLVVDAWQSARLPGAEEEGE